MELTQIVSDVGVAATVSGAASIALRPSEPRYVLGAAIGIPLSLFVDAPEPLGLALGGMYIGGIAAYSIAHLSRASERATRIASGVGLTLGAGLGALAHYL